MSRLSSSKTARNTSTANWILIYGHESLWRNRRESRPTVQQNLHTVAFVTFVVQCRDIYDRMPAVEERFKSPTPPCSRRGFKKQIIECGLRAS